MKTIDKKLDHFWSQIIKKRAGNKCEYCHKTIYLNAHHVFCRRNKSVRWELSNGVCLCAKHHTFSSTFSAHQAPLAFVTWIINERGKEWHDALTIEANRTRKWTIAEKEELLQELRQCLENECLASE